jgi:hypothetical protein
MAPFADPVRLGGIGELVADDRWRPNRTGITKRQHSLKMCAIANNVRP